MSNAPTYTFSANGHADLKVDVYTGKIVSNLSDQDAVYWANYLTNLAKGIVNAGLAFDSIARDWTRVVRPANMVAKFFDLTAIVVRADKAATPRESVQILAAGIASTIVGISAGCITGYAAAGLTLLIASPAAPAWIITLAIFAVVGVPAYCNGPINLRTRSPT